ncbi:helicase-related protein [Treponema putidum]|uniref:Helicase n=1 Tax=Treponema putidum TaxID=221027 RepID=A0AAE9SI27_9SPIR|nr:helicase-related protein [Treponema putidum]UTY33660.1 helicase [Treponema putidum]
MQSTLIDNSEHLKLTDTLKELINIPGITRIDIATGYWDIPGTQLIAEELRAFLERSEDAHLRILIGKDPYLFAQYSADVKYKDADYPQDFIRTDLADLKVKSEYIPAVQLLLDFCKEQHEGQHDPKIEIRIFRGLSADDKQQFFHSKCYIFYGEGRAFGIIGSSNFTGKGLQENSELNYLETVPQIITAKPDEINRSKGHISWFNEKWALASDWTQEFLEEVLRKSEIGIESEKTERPSQSQHELPCTILSPYQTYIKFLIDQFDEVINGDGKITPDEYIPHDEEFKQLTYQNQAVNQGFAIMKRHQGFILADVVGLGKTFTALMIVKRHLIETNFTHPVLIITPPAIHQSWLDSINYFDKNETSQKKIKQRINLTTIGRLDDSGESDDYADGNDFDLVLKKEQYGMIVVDESHRFRNSNTLMYQKLDNLIGSINPQPYVMLLSATPQNNAPYDLRNQIYLFQREHKNATLCNLGEFGNDLERYFKEKQDRYKQYIQRYKLMNGIKIQKTPEELAQDKKNLIADNKDIRKHIVELLIIRRTRTDIEKYYQDDVKTQALKFPKINKPIEIPYEMKGELGNLFNSTINIIAPQVSQIDTDEAGNQIFSLGTEAGKDGLGYYRYRAIEFLKNKEHRALYEVKNLTVSNTAERLAQLMEMLLVKRLESSQAAFKESLHNLSRYTENMIRMWEVNRIFICPDLDVNKELGNNAIKNNDEFKQCLDMLADKAKKANKRNSGSEYEGSNKEYKRADFDESYITLLRNDLQLIKNLCSKWDVQTADPKMSTFIYETANQFLNKRRNKNRKLIIFTECIATQKALVQKLYEMPIPHCNVLSITSANRDDMKDIIAANFDANYKGEKRDDYQILITTDVLSEGVNLHRANSILNYDSPWNATRLMQRLGRINRIGTEAKEIWNYNFYPSTLGDAQINIKNRTYIKLQTFHELFGEDSQIYSTKEEVRHFDPVIYETSDDEESPLMPFIAELQTFQKEQPDEYAKLKSIDKPVISAIQNQQHGSFAAMHEYNDRHEYMQSLLYFSSNIKTQQVSQLEFFEALKPLIQLETQQSEIKIDTITACKRSIMECYEKDKQNSALIIRQRNSKQNKEITQARTKIQELYTSINSVELHNMLDAISDAIMHHNSALAKKVLKIDFDNTGLFDNKADVIKELYQLAHQNKPETDTYTALSIALITER